MKCPRGSSSVLDIVVESVQSLLARGTGGSGRSSERMPAHLVRSNIVPRNLSVMSLGFFTERKILFSVVAS